MAVQFTIPWYIWIKLIVIEWPHMPSMNWVIIGLGDGNGLFSGLHKAILWTSADFVAIEHLRPDFNDIWIKHAGNCQDYWFSYILCQTWNNIGSYWINFIAVGQIGNNSALVQTNRQRLDSKQQHIFN